MEINEETPFPEEFRAFLQDELVRRIRANPKYSMRMFAKFLGVESSRLSKMLRGQRPIRSNFVEDFGYKIGLKPDIIEDYKRAADAKIRGFVIPKQDKAYQQLTLDTFEILSDWLHHAVLELMKLNDFEPSNKYVASKLGVSINEASMAIERLIRTKLIIVKEDGSWTDTSDGFSTVVLGKNTTSNAHKHMQEQILNKAIKALQNIAIEKRDQSAMTMATSARKLNLAKEMIKDFRRQLCAFLEDEPEKDAVYHLSISLYPVTTEKNEQALSTLIDIDGSENPGVLND